MKKLLSLMLAIAMIVSMASVSLAQENKDTYSPLCFGAVPNSRHWLEWRLSKRLMRWTTESPSRPNGPPAEDTKTKLPTLMVANTVPDLFMCWSSGYIKPYVEAGKVFSLSDALAADPEWADSFLGGIMDNNTFGR